MILTPSGERGGGAGGGGAGGPLVRPGPGDHQRGSGAPGPESPQTPQNPLPQRQATERCQLYPGTASRSS